MTPLPVRPRRFSIYFDFADWWVGVYIGENNIFVCPIPTLVLRWRRGFAQDAPGRPAIVDGSRR